MTRSVLPLRHLFGPHTKARLVSFALYVNATADSRSTFFDYGRHGRFVYHPQYVFGLLKSARQYANERYRLFSRQ